MDFEIIIHTDFSSKKLIKSWKYLEENNPVYPQMTYDWIEPWVNLKSFSKKVFIVEIKNQSKPVMISPFIVKTIFGFKILHSMPIHYGDIFHFLIDTKYNVNILCEYLFKEIRKHKFIALKITKVKIGTSLNNYLNENYFGKVISASPYAKLGNIDFTNFEKSIKKKVLKNSKSRLKNLQKIGKVDFILSSSPKTYLDSELRFREIYEDRWRKIDKNLPNDDFYLCRRESYIEMLKSKKAMMAILYLNNNIIGYRLGFIYENVFYSWKLSFDVNYNKYGIGSMLSLFLIKELIQNKFNGLNHGNGNYSYKRDWSNEEPIALNEYTISNNRILGYLYLKFENSFKDLAKRIINFLR